MIDQISLWARRSPDPCPTCGAVTNAPCSARAEEVRIFPLDGGSAVHFARIHQHPVAAALWALKAAAVDPRSAEAFDTLLAAAIVAVAELAAHDSSSCKLLFDAFAGALARAAS